MKILHVLSTPRNEGTPNLVLDWLKSAKHEQCVFVLHSDPADLTEQLQRGAAWYDEGQYFSHGRRKFPGIVDRIRAVCRELHPDLLICWTPGFANWISLGARFAGVYRILIHCGNPPRRGSKGDWITRSILWPARLLGGRVICCSGFVRSELSKIPFLPTRNLHVVWNGADLSRFRRERTKPTTSPTSPTARAAIMVANLERARDHETLLRAARIILKEHPDFRLLLVGGGSKRESLVQLAFDLGLSESVEFTGPRADVPDLFCQSSLFVFSTLEEGFGTVLVEAMAAGLPIVATDVPACREVLAGGRFGTLVPCGDAEAMADAILHRLKTPLSESEKQEVAEHAATFRIDHMIEQYLHIANTA